MHRITRIIGLDFTVDFTMFIESGANCSNLVHVMKRSVQGMFSSWAPNVYPREGRYEFFCLIRENYCSSDMSGHIYATSQLEATAKYRTIMSKIFRKQYPVKDLIEGRQDTIYCV